MARLRQSHPVHCTGCLTCKYHRDARSRMNVNSAKVVEFDSCSSSTYAEKIGRMLDDADIRIKKEGKKEEKN